MRDLVTTGYDGTVSNFMLNELNIGELAGIRAVGQARFIDDLLVPQAGLSIFQMAGPVPIYGAATVNVDGKAPVTELLLDVRYALPGFRDQDVSIWNALA